MNEDESRKRDHSPLAAKNGRRTIWVPTTRQKKNNKTLPINWLITAAIKCASCLYATLLLPSIDTFLGHIEREGWSRSSTIGRFLLLCFFYLLWRKVNGSCRSAQQPWSPELTKLFFSLSNCRCRRRRHCVCVCIYLSVADGGSHHYTQLPDHPNRRGVVVVVLCRELGREIRATSFDIHHHGVDCSIDLHRDVSESGFLGGGLDDLHH